MLSEEKIFLLVIIQEQVMLIWLVTIKKLYKKLNKNLKYVKERLNPGNVSYPRPTSIHIITKNPTIAPTEAIFPLLFLWASGIMSSKTT